MKWAPILFVIGISIFQPARKRGSQQAGNYDPCRHCLSQDMCLMYVSRTRPINITRSNGCTKCNGDSREQWNALYRMYGGRESVVFIVVFPEEILQDEKPKLSYDLSLTMDVKDSKEDDLFLLCRNGSPVLEHIGQIDTEFIRKVHNTLAMLSLDNGRAHSH